MSYNYFALFQHRVDLLPSTLEKLNVKHCSLGDQTRHATNPRCENPAMEWPTNLIACRFHVLLLLHRKLDSIPCSRARHALH
eukprot:c12233_g1_i1 orf=215-460(-)